MTSFQVAAVCPATGARAGVLGTPHGEVATPAFMPVATQASVKSLSPEDLHNVGAKLLLANTYHLMLRPGVEVVQSLGGLHRFMGWTGPALTDSGGFQVFSLADLSRVSDEGVLFRSHLDGSEHFLTPEKATALQEALGADLIMALDQCPPYTADREAQRQAMERTHRWAERSLRSHPDASAAGQALFGIIQGGVFADLRRESARAIVSLGFAGYALGGLCLGETKAVMNSVVAETAAFLPADRPRYLMGVGSPEDLVEGVARGMDLFDSALPTRVARHGSVFTREGRVNLRNASFRLRDGPVDPDCDCHTCRAFSAAYLHHLFRAGELLGYRLATIHNLRFVMRLMESMRLAVVQGGFPSFQKDFLSRYRPTDEEVRAREKRRWLEHRGRAGT